MDRRSFLKVIGTAALTAAPVTSARARSNTVDTEFSGILIDTTRCIGCQTCSEVCAELNKLPAPEVEAIDEIEGFRPTTPTQLTVINRFENGDEEIFLKRQCMHCNQPACAAACPTKAMLKTEAGPVIWRADRCMGCRYCMISCPFDIPKFEYDKAVPSIRKCILCFERLKEGETPACAENCPAEALLFDKRRDLLLQARRRISEEPDRYVHHIYGEHEAGGTSMLYLAGIPFEKLAMKTELEHVAYPEFTKTFLYSVPIILMLWPPFLLALNRATEKENETTIENEAEEPWKY